MKLLLTVSILLFCFSLRSQNKISNDSIYWIVEKMPEYPGGDIALRKYIAQNIKYDNIHTEDIECLTKIYVRFHIDENGEVKSPKIVRGCSNSNILEIIENMPKWKPGEHKGKKVKVRYNIPINIHIQ